MYSSLILLVLLCVSPNSIHGFCIRLWKNPRFSNRPQVNQITPSVVRVSWEKVVTHRECVDRFLVRYWETSKPKDVLFTQTVGQEVKFFDFKVLPNVEYAFQVIAREIKSMLGYQFDTDDHLSSVTLYRTSYDPGNGS